MGLDRFDDKAFRNHMSGWVEQVADEHLSRAWDVVVGCLAVHAKLDRQPKQSKAQAMREAYEEFAAIYICDHEGTHTMIGMWRELESMCPPELVEDGIFNLAIHESVALARGLDIEEEWEDEDEEDEDDDIYYPPEPVFKVLEGGKK